MRLHKSDYIRLWYIAALRQLTTTCSIPQEDITIFDGLLEVRRRFVEKLEKYQEEADNIENHYNSMSPNEPNQEGKHLKDPHVKSIYAWGKIIRKENAITKDEINELSFELFETIPEVASFYVYFKDVVDLYFF